MDGRAAAAISAQHRMQLRFRNFNLKCDCAWLLMALLCAFVRAALQLAPAPSRAGVIMYCKLAII